MKNTPEPFFEPKKLLTFLELAVKHYEKAPAWFVNYLDELYMSMNDGWQKITLDEILTVANLYTDNQWEHEWLACNRLYKLFDRIGRDTSGIIGY